MYVKSSANRFFSVSSWEYIDIRYTKMPFFLQINVYKSLQPKCFLIVYCAGLTVKFHYLSGVIQQKMKSLDETKFQRVLKNLGRFLDILPPKTKIIFTIIWNRFSTLSNFWCCWSEYNLPYSFVLNAVNCLTSYYWQHVRLMMSHWFM